MANGRGLLADAFNSPMFNVGIGLLANSGPSTTPTSLGQGLARGLQFAQNAQQQNLRNQLVRSRLEDDARRRRASEQLGGLLSGGDNPTMGLLADIAPGAVAQGLLGQMFPRSTSTLQLLEAAGIDPASPEGRELITGRLSSDKRPTFGTRSCRRSTRWRAYVS